MMAQCTDHTQLKSIYGVSRVTCSRTPAPPITSQRSEGMGLRLLMPAREGFTHYELCQREISTHLMVFEGWQR